MSTDLSVFMEGGRASGSAPEQVGIITRFAGIYLRIGGTGIPEYLHSHPEGLSLAVRHGRATLASQTVQRHLSVHEFLTVGRDDRARTGRTVKDGVRYNTLSMLTPVCKGGTKVFLCHAVNRVGTTA